MAVSCSRLYNPDRTKSSMKKSSNKARPSFMLIVLMLSLSKKKASYLLFLSFTHPDILLLLSMLCLVAEYALEKHVKNPFQASIFWFFGVSNLILGMRGAAFPVGSSEWVWKQF